MNRLMPPEGCSGTTLPSVTAFLAMTVIIAGGLIAPPCSRAATEPLQFEVASVRRNTTCGMRRGGGRPGAPGRLNQECMTVMGLMMTAYGVFADGVSNSFSIPEITGGPGWLVSDTYDITAKAEGAAPFPQMAGPMLRTLLEDRFKLKLHRDTKVVPVYFLTVAKNGPKLEASKQGSCVPLDPTRPPAQNMAPGQPLPNYCGPRFQLKGATATLASHGATLKQVVDALLSRFVGRPVIDKTGLSGQYDFQIEFEYPADGTAPPDPDSPAGSIPTAPSIFDVLQSKLGLKLESGKGPVEILVIDSVERPTEN